MASRDPETDFGTVQDELDAAVAAFVAYTCELPGDLAAFSEALWFYIDNGKAESAEWGSDATAPLAEFFQVAAAVRREMGRIL